MTGKDNPSDAAIELRRQKEEIRREELDRLQKIASRVPGLVYQYCLRPDGSGCMPYASDAIREMFRVSAEEVREDASKVLSKVHPDDYAACVASIQKSAEDLSPWQHEFRVKFDDGMVHWRFGNALPQREADGSTLWHGFISDITDRKQAEAEIRDMALRKERIIEGTRAGTWEWNIQTGETVFNDIWAQIIGYTLEELAPVSIKTGKHCVILMI